MIVYALVDPVSKELRYIGQTCAGLPVRLHRHIRDARHRNSAPVKGWIRSLLAKGLVPAAFELENSDTREDLDESEKFWIEYARAIGCRLTNLAPGGRARFGWRHTKEAREKISIALRGKKATPDQIRANSENRKREWIECPNFDRISAMIRAWRGQRHSEETKSRISSAHVGMRHSEETLAKMRASSQRRWQRVAAERASLITTAPEG